MEPLHTAALALQRHLLNLRRELAALETHQQVQAEHLAALIAHIEQALSSLPATLKPPSLQ
jgi:hypothetical protein